MGEEAAERAAFKAHAKRYTVYQIALIMSARKKRCGKGLLIAHLQYTKGGRLKKWTASFKPQI